MPKRFNLRAGNFDGADSSRDMSLFVDTSIWYAAADSSDRSNARSKAILKSGETLVTSDHVLIETWTLLHHTLDRKAAERFWEGLRSGIAATETVTLAHLEVAWDIGVFLA